MDDSKREELDKKWKVIAARAVTDEAFKKKLVADPVGVMVENGLTLPEGMQMKVGAGKTQTIPIASNASEEMKKEVKWWTWRLDIIREFGKEDPKANVGHLSMSSQESEHDSSGIS